MIGKYSGALFNYSDHLRGFALFLLVGSEQGEGYHPQLDVEENAVKISNHASLQPSPFLYSLLHFHVPILYNLLGVGYLGTLIEVASFGLKESIHT